MDNHRIIRCAIYDRVSTDIQVKEGLSLEAQRQALTEYALAHGYQIVGYYADEGITARKKLQNRKELLRLLNDVKADQIDLILVTKLDRWFRNIKDYHNTQAILESHNCNWKTIFEEYDTSTSNGRFAINIMLSVNENECDRDSERILTVFEYKKQNREHLTGRPAYGYIADKNKRLVKDPETSQVVDEIFNYYFTTFSKKATVRHITEKYGEKAPTIYQINRILSCETYTGCMFGIHDYCESYITRSQLHKIRTVSDSKIIPRQAEPFLFSSIMKCPICGKNMSGFVKKAPLKNGTKRIYKRYRCGAKFTEYHNGACISETVIESYLLSNIVNEITFCITRLEQQQKKKEKTADKTISIQSELERLNNMYQKGRIKEAYYDEQYCLLSEKLNSDHVPDKNIDILNPYKNLASLFSAGWEDMYKQLDAAHKKAFWKEIISEITIDKISRKINGFQFMH